MINKTPPPLIFPGVERYFYIICYPLKIYRMFEEYERKKRKQVTSMRSIMDYGMGILMILVGLFFIFHEKLKLAFADFASSSFDKIFGAMCVIYGIWRIYRGYQKNYFR